MKCDRIAGGVAIDEGRGVDMFFCSSQLFDREVDVIDIDMHYI